MSLQELYNKLNALIQSLQPGQPLLVGYDQVADDNFFYLVLLMKQPGHFTIYKPALTWVDNNKELDLTGELQVYNTISSDFKLAFTIDANSQLISVVTGTLPSLNLGDMASLKLIDPKADSVAYFPNLDFKGVAMKAASDTLSMSLDAIQHNTGWNILGLSLFPLTDIGYHFEATIAQGSQDPLPQFWFLGKFQLGQTIIQLSVKIPVSSMDTQGQWLASFSSPTPLTQAFQDLSNLLFFNNLNDSVPGSILNMPHSTPDTGIFLDELSILFSIPNRSLQYVNINASARGNWTMGPIQLTYSEIFLGFVPGSTSSGMQLSIEFTLTMAFGSLDPLSLTLSIPSIKDNWTVTLNDYSAMSSMDDIKNIPGSVDKSNFHFPSQIDSAKSGLSLRNFTAVFNPFAASWSEVGFEITYKANWTVLPNFFSIKKVALQLTVSNSSPQEGVTVTGYFSTDIWLGPSDTGFAMNLYAEKKESSWFFSVSAEKILLSKIIQQLLGSSFTLPGPAANIVVDYIRLSIDTGENSYSGSGSISMKWPISIAGTTYDLSANVSTTITAKRNDPKPYSGFVQGIINIPDAPGFGNAGLILRYDFGENNIYKAEFMGVTVTFNADDGLVTLNLGDITLGDIVRKMISWAEPNSTATLESPWDMLNDISLKGLNFFFNIKDKSFGFEYKPGNGLDLGIVTIYGIGLKYVKVNNEYQVQLLLDGQLFGKPIPAWNVLNPDSAPKVPGRGDSNFDLDFLALGQHVSLRDTTKINNLDQAIKAYKSAFKEPTDPNKIPINDSSPVIFNPNSNWLIGARFIVMNTVDLGVIFNDPELYGLLVKLSGEKAKIFSGLEFQIIYKKVSDTIGVYEIELKLPDAMRHLEFGAVSVTLPVLGLQIYTNGNFRVDLGFPWNNDFSRSFTVQAFPFIGSGGFYFAWLSGATSTNVPRITSGNFNPVIEFGLGVSLGLGKTIDEGILSGGLSVTVVGILQGIIGFYNPNPLPDGSPATSAANFYAIQGTFAIVGRVFGAVDFAIVKASLDITVYAMVRITFICYEPIVIYLEAGVSVTVTVSIDLGLFSIDIHLSFSATLRQTFTIGSASTPPWTLAPQQSRHLLRAHHLLLSVANAATPLRKIDMSWIPLKYATTVLPPILSIYFMPSLTAALDEAAVQPTQLERYMTMLYIETANPSQKNPPASSFTSLAQSIIAWAINADTTDKTWQTDIYDEVLAQKVDINYLQNVYTYLTCQPQVSIPADKINSFLENAFTVNVIYRNTAVSGDKLYGSIFPMFPLLTQSAVFNSQPYGQPIDFASHNTVGQQYQDDITAYFARITVNYLNPLEASQNSCSMYSGVTPPPVAPTSMAGFIYQDYFLLMAKGGIGEAIKLMKAYPYDYQGELLTNIASEFGISAAAIALSNKSALVVKGLQLTISGIDHTTDGNETLNSLSATYGETITDIIAINRTVTTLLKGSVTISLNNGSKKYTTVTGNSFQDIANHLTIDPTLDTVSGSIPDLVAQTDICTVEGLFDNDKTMPVHPPVYHIVPDDTINTIVTKYNPGGTTGSLTKYSFAAINAINAGLLIAGATVPLGPGNKYILTSTDTLLILADCFTSGNLNNLVDIIADLKILQPLSPAFLPPFVYTAGEKDSFESMSNAFLLPIETLTDNNPSIQQVWPDNTTITLTNIAALTIKAIVDKLQQTGALNNLSGMAARFLLNGLRLPAPKQLSAARALLKDDWETTLDTYPIYELTGQYINLPLLTTSSAFSIILNKDAGAEWINFEVITQSVSGNIGANDLTVVLDAADINRVIAIQTETLNPTVDVLRPQPPFTEIPRQFNFSNPVSWQYNSSVPIWTGMQPGTIPSLWNIPDSLLQAAFNHKTLLPLVKLEVGTHDNPNAPLTTTDVANYAWALQVPLTVSRLPKDNSGADASLLPHVYQVNGTDEAGLVYLERLLLFNKQPGQDILKAVHILYAPNPSGGHGGGLQSNGLDITTAFIVKTNFSTESHPVLAMAEVLNAETVTLNSTPKDFVEKVWEASIVQTGGFYLYYSYGADGNELPASLFNNNATANLQLLITFNNSLPSDTIYDFMNTVAVGQNINTGNSILFAEAQDQAVNYLYTTATTFAGIAAQYNILADDLGRALQKNLFAANIPFTISGIQYEVKPGDSLNSIVAYFGPGQTGFEQKLHNANPNLKDADYSVVWTMVNIPAISFTTGVTIVSLTTMEQVCKYYYIDIASLSNQVQMVAGLFAGTVSFNDKLVERKAVIAAGNAGIEMQRKKPDPAGPGAYLPPLFNLLGVSIAANNDFKESGEGLPASSRDMDSAIHGSLALAVRDTDSIWQYLKALPVAPYAKSNNMISQDAIPELLASNPYAGVGGTAQVNMEWLDLYGNHTKTPFSFPNLYPPATPGPLNYLPVKIRYTDPLAAIEKWPNLGVNFVYQTVNNAASLELIFNFDVSKYAVYQPVDPSEKVNPSDPSSPTRGEQFVKDQSTALTNAKTDLQTYRNIYYQVWQKDVTITINDTVSNQQWILSDAQMKQVRSLLNDIYNYLAAIISSGIAYTYYEVMPADIKDCPYNTAVYLAGKLNVKDVNQFISINLGLQHPFGIDGSVSNDYKIIVPSIILPVVQVISGACADNDPAPIFELKCQFTIARDTTLVDDDFADTGGVGAVQTTIKPISNALSYSLAQYNTDFDTPGSAQLALSDFAGYFEDAYNKQYPGTTYKIATGTPLTEVVANNASKQLWVIRFGTRGIQYTISGQPLYFSPAPLANSLLSFTGDKSVPIRPFDKTSGLGNPVNKNFAGINLDTWASVCLSAIDQFLLPQYAIPAYIVDQYAASDDERYLPQILTAKQVLAQAIVSSLPADPLNSRFINILTNPPLAAGNLKEAQEALRQLLLIKLENAYNVDAVVQFKADVVSPYPNSVQTIAPNLYGQPLATEVKSAAGTANEQTQVFSLSTAKLGLVNGGSHFTFTFSTKNKQDQKNFVLDLSYQVNHIEYDITPITVTGFAGPGKEDYNASTWLSLVKPMDPVPIVVSPQDPSAEIPVPLRTYPTPPSLVSQVPVPQAVTGSGEKERLSELLQWQYTYTYSQIEAAQDSINTQLQFNVMPPDKKPFNALPPDQQLFADLAQFNEVYTAVQDVFATQLAAITPGSGSSEMDGARVAMKAFATMVTAVSQSWQHWNQPTEKDYMEVKTSDTYKYHILEENKINYEDKGQKEDVLAAILSTLNTAAVGFDLPAISIDGFDTEPCAGTANGFVFRNKNTSELLLYKDRQKYKQRILSFAYTNILCNQNAWASVAQLRNFDLVDGNPTTDSFIYKTPDVRFANYLVPYIDTINYPKLQPFNIYLLGTDDPISKNTLESIIGTLFKTLFSAVTNAQKIKLGISYRYTLTADPGSTAIDLPFYITPPVPFTIPGDYESAPGCSDTPTGVKSFACRLAYYMRKWFTDGNPSINNAQFLLDLSVYSTLDSSQQMPVLRIRNFYLKLDNISNPRLTP